MEKHANPSEQKLTNHEEKALGRPSLNDHSNINNSFRNGTLRQSVSNPKAHSLSVKVKKAPQNYQQRSNGRGESTTYNHRVAQAHQELQQFFEKFDCKDDSDCKDGCNSKLYNHVKRPKKYDNMFPSSSEDSRNGESCLQRNMFGESKFDEGDGAN